MALTHKLPKVACRHLQAADMLCADSGHRTDVAGYLKGRNVKPISVFIFNDAFMNHWEMGMRRADARQIGGNLVDAWQ